VSSLPVAPASVCVNLQLYEDNAELKPMKHYCIVLHHLLSTDAWRVRASYDVDGLRPCVVHLGNPSFYRHCSLTFSLFRASSAQSSVPLPPPPFLSDDGGSNIDILLRVMWPGHLATGDKIKRLHDLLLSPTGYNFIVESGLCKNKSNHFWLRAFVCA